MSRGLWLMCRQTSQICLVQNEGRVSLVRCSVARRFLGCLRWCQINWCRQGTLNQAVERTACAMQEALLLYQWISLGNLFVVAFSDIVVDRHK